ncbi:type IV secretory system conjugative DNA transfer family protein [Sulfurovum sp. bin170]|uniref:type IV secretory system conjugative DNA transfer family protein n=1 Tax=Sulfurovum sp. bin170 TaxID=2695268 RepID=UPI0013E0C4FE|nr:type IV secretory system conjugative DNA transfer family protein [Sulfurovum sp. bin170]NEW59906.1 type IV secretory system conjugative DNA transfer family protein [Sulfurovum sp. bin170]
MSSKIKKFLILFIVFTIFSSITTQFLAYTFEYQPSLRGEIYPHIYQPYAWIEWHINYYREFEPIFLDIYSQVLFGFSIFAIVYMTIFLLFKRKEKKHLSVHGTAHWATKKEIEATHTLNRKDGLYIGGWKEKRKALHYLRHNGEEHVITFAPTRSGKGVGLVIPTLLSWAESAIVLDIKGENYAITAGWRKHYANNKILKFNPNDPTGESSKFNPLEEIRLDSTYEIADTENIVIMLLDEKGEGLKDFWEKGGKTFLSSFILHTLYIAKNEHHPIPSLSDIYKSLNDKELDNILADMSSYYHDQANELTHPAISTGAMGLINLADRTRGDIIATVNNILSLYIDPVIELNTKRSDFKLSELMNSQEPVTLYIVIDPENIDRMQPLFRVLMLQILKKLIKKLEFKNGKQTKSYKHRMLLMLDEFTAVGKIDFFEKSLAYMAGYGITAYIIIQDIEQLYRIYSKEETITSNCHIKIAFTPNKEDTASLLSKMTGTTTVVKSNITTSGKRLSLILGSVSQSYQEVSRPLMTVDEILRLPKAKTTATGEILDGGEMLIFIAGHAPIRGKQILFFKDQVFLDRSEVNL